MDFDAHEALMDQLDAALDNQELEVAVSALTAMLAESLAQLTEFQRDHEEFNDTVLELATSYTQFCNNPNPVTIH